MWEASESLQLGVLLNFELRPTINIPGGDGGGGDGDGGGGGGDGDGGGGGDDDDNDELYV